MITVQKYLATTASGEIGFGLDLPTGARLCGVGTEGSSCYVFAKVDTAQATQSRTFLSVPTGTAITLSQNLTYVGTAHVDPGPTYHFFEIL